MTSSQTSGRSLQLSCHLHSTWDFSWYVQGTNLDSYDLQTILVDPPRAGLDPKTMELLSEFKNIIYISCNPDTLKANLQQISGSHDIAKFAVFDQFPYTHHIECGVLLCRRAAAAVAKKRKLEDTSVT